MIGACDGERPSQANKCLGWVKRPAEFYPEAKHQGCAVHLFSPPPSKLTKSG